MIQKMGSVGLVAVEACPAPLEHDLKSSLAYTRTTPRTTGTTPRNTRITSRTTRTIHISSAWHHPCGRFWKTLWKTIWIVSVFLIRTGIRIVNVFLIRIVKDVFMRHKSQW